MTIEQAEQYFADLVEVLNKMCQYDQSPWVFVCASTMIEYLSKLRYGRAGIAGYLDFINSYMPASYRSFTYKSGVRDLPAQMYYVLRCGIVHSFSLVPDQTSASNGGRIRSIALSHDELHLSSFSSVKAPDACCLRADTFITDLKEAIKKLFEDARNTPRLRPRVETRLNAHPPIMFDPG